MRFIQVVALVLLMSASCGSRNSDNNTVGNSDLNVNNVASDVNTQAGYSASDTVSTSDIPQKNGSGDFRYPDPWQESYKSTGLLYALSWQYNTQKGQQDKLQIHDSTGYDANGKAVIQKKNTVVKYSRFDKNGFISNVAFEGDGLITVKFAYQYYPIEGENAWQQKAYSMKNKVWKAPFMMGDTERSYPPVRMQFDNRHRLLSEHGAGQDIRYAYNQNGFVAVIRDSSMNTLANYKGALESRYYYNDAGVVTKYQSFVNGKIREEGVFSRPGLPDTMKVLGPGGDLQTYRVFKYKTR
jgi:YD repeat-containing protein